MPMKWNAVNVQIVSTFTRPSFHSPEAVLPLTLQLLWLALKLKIDIKAVGQGQLKEIVDSWRT